MNKYEIGQRVYFIRFDDPCSGEVTHVGDRRIVVNNRIDVSEANFKNIFPTKEALLAHLTKQVEGLGP